MPSDNEYKEPMIPRHWHELYFHMQADPLDQRTDTQFCEDIKLDRQTFQAWKTKYRKYVFREVDKLRQDYRNELRARMYKSIAKKLDKDTNAIKLLAQLMGDLVEKTETRVEMSDADKIRRIESLRGQVAEREKQWKNASEGTGEEPDGSKSLTNDPGAV